MYGNDEPDAQALADAEDALRSIHDEEVTDSVLHPRHTTLSGWVKRNLDYAQVQRSRGSEYEG